MSTAKHLNIDEVSKTFHLPIKEAAQMFGVCSAVIKRCCRENGVSRWPFRKLRSVQRKLGALPEAVVKLTNHNGTAVSAGANADSSSTNMLTQQTHAASEGSQSINFMSAAASEDKPGLIPMPQLYSTYGFLKNITPVLASTSAVDEMPSVPLTLLLGKTVPPPWPGIVPWLPPPCIAQQPSDEPPDEHIFYLCHNFEQFGMRIQGPLMPLPQQHTL
eukprot:TRINITY_DN9109_c0_g1_i1.p1 TRINITY_DN9109_c0_g1~~TRINITY_DN9109_c0_g1_i1.p1  ORF type:complete len:217 (-),score=24.48 TRINITY_DN9109_c0_g1_i1:132-782(-)